MTGEKLKSGHFAELLSPAGSPEALEAALRCGADAVYIGGKSFSARQNAHNFEREEILDAVRLCHTYGAKVYQAINTCANDRELSALGREIEFACRAGIDGIIVQDHACAMIVARCCPQMPIHASTQLTIHSENGVLWAKEQGYSRVVLSRELSEEIITRLSGLGIETEIFVHGALCMSVSGQCYLSAMIGSRSANRGLCAGACRLPFSAGVARARDEYALSLKDMALDEDMSWLKRCGAASLKIEGRMKRAEYVAATADAYSKAMCGESYDRDTLRAVFSRSGFTDGYFSGMRTKDMFGARRQEDEALSESVLPQIRKMYQSAPQKFVLDLTLEARAGQECRVRASDGVNEVRLSFEPAQAAINKPTDPQRAAEQLSKLGGTLYRAGKISADIDAGLMIPVSHLNEMRREAVSALDSERCRALTKIKPFDHGELERLISGACKPSGLKGAHAGKLKYVVRVQNIGQLAEMELDKVYRIVLPLGKYRQALDAGLNRGMVVLSLPRFTFDEDGVLKKMTAAFKSGFRVFECTNCAHMRMVKLIGGEAVGGFGLNITNSLAAKSMERSSSEPDKLRAMTLSFELKASQIREISKNVGVPTGALIYGKLPLMLMVNCPIRAQVGCKNCKKRLTDRTGAAFPVLCAGSDDLDYYELLNSKPLVMSDKQCDPDVDFGILYFTDESPEQAAKALSDCIEGSPPQGDFTRGLYYRGII